jgi:hypothetical protein
MAQAKTGNPVSKIIKVNRAGGVARTVEPLSSKCENFGSNWSMEYKKIHKYYFCM